MDDLLSYYITMERGNLWVMSDISLDLDISDLLSLDKDLSAFEGELNRSVQLLAGQTHLHILEEAQQRLHSRREMYVKALAKPSEVSPGVWMITLGAEASFIEEGGDAHSMVKDLLGDNPKVAADGCVLNPRNKVLTSLGWKKIKDIVPGDMVLSHSGKFREVKELLIRPAGIGTEYVRLLLGSDAPGSASKANSELTSPAISLTVEHLVLTPKGWVEAGNVKKGDLVASPGDLKRPCRTCGQPLPVNAPLIRYCINNRCARQAAYKDGKTFNFSLDERRRHGKKANDAAKASGCFDRLDWGARDVSHLGKMRLASAKSMRALASDGRWAPEIFFEKCLTDVGVEFERERPIKTDRITNAGSGRVRKSTLFLDFFIPKLKLVIELDGVQWHSQPDQIARDEAKNVACQKAGYRVLRVPSHRIYRRGPRLAKHIALWLKNHSGELGISWVRIKRVIKGTVTRPDHAYAKKYDICLDAEEHSFCCETIFIHNSRYRVIPFHHKGGGPASNTPAENELVTAIKSELKKLRIPWAGIERNPDGSPQSGTLHRIKMATPDRRISAGATEPGPNQHGWGHGGLGQPMQGPTGIPFLQGLRISQSPLYGADGKPKLDSKGQHMASRDISTFRIVSSKHEGSRWMYPAKEGVHLFESAMQWAEREWDSKILPELIKKLGAE